MSLTLDELLKGPGREHFRPSSIERLQKREGASLSGAIAEAAKRARRELPKGSDEEIAVRTVQRFLQAIGEIPQKPSQNSNQSENTTPAAAASPEPAEVAGSAAADEGEQG